MHDLGMLTFERCLGLSNNTALCILQDETTDQVDIL